jgi:Ca-activated chloride channel homolog
VVAAPHRAWLKLVYNFGMPPKLTLSACGILALLTGSAAQAFQAPGESAVSIAPRVKRVTPPNPGPNPGDVPPAELRIDSALVQVPAHVTREDGTTLANLAPENFHVFEDGVEQRITHFTREDAPLSVGLLFDSSGSMRDKMPKSLQATAAFFKTANAQDEFFLVEFSERPKLTVPFTTDPGQIYQRILHMRPFGRTSLLDAIHLALQQMKNATHSRKAIVIVSDGGDNRSRYTAREIKNGMLESDVQLYAMGIFDSPGRESKKLPAEEKNGPHLLNELAEQSGGRHYPVGDLDDLPSISEDISRDLRNEYVIGYSPSNGSRDGKYRQIRLQVSAPDASRIRTDYRRGYYAPAQ